MTIHSSFEVYSTYNLLISLQVIVLWTANTERFCDVAAGLNDTAQNLLRSIDSNEEEVSPSTIFAVASVLEGVSERCIKSYGYVVSILESKTICTGRVIFRMTFVVEHILTHQIQNVL